MHINERVIIYQYHQDTGHQPELTLSRGDHTIPSEVPSVNTFHKQTGGTLSLLSLHSWLVLANIISIPISLSGKNSPNLRNKRVARLSVLAVFLSPTVTVETRQGLQGQDNGHGGSDPSYFSSCWHLTVIFAIYIINVCDSPVRAGYD